MTSEKQAQKSGHTDDASLPRYVQWRVISMEFLLSFLSRHFLWENVGGSRNVVCFLRLKLKQLFCLQSSISKER